jgi:Activator of Hsp90 ATPase homolog 1-like protein
MVRVSIDVDVDPATAFTVFTDEIDAWYERGRHAFYDTKRALGIRFEPGVGGRLLEVYDAASGDGREMGRITVWEPGRRLMFVDTRGTEVEVTFAESAGGTHVTLEHRGLERLDDHTAEHHARFGWRLLVPWYEKYVKTGARHG